MPFPDEAAGFQQAHSVPTLEQAGILHMQVGRRWLRYYATKQMLDRVATPIVTGVPTVQEANAGGQKA